MDEALNETLVWQYLEEKDPRKAEEMLERFSAVMPTMEAEYIEAVRQLSMERRLRNADKGA